MISSLRDAAATQHAGRRLGQAILAHTDARHAPLLIALSGELGAGKTTFVSGVLEAFGLPGPARSPTYTLVEPHVGAGRDLVHADFYRLRHADELDDLGWRDYERRGAVLLVEWPEKAVDRLRPPDILVTLRYGGEDTREVEIAGQSAAGLAIAGQLSALP